MVKILASIIILVSLTLGYSERYSVYYEAPKEDYKAYNDSSFVAGDSPVTLSIYVDLERKTYNGEVGNDGVGDLYVKLSSDSETYGDSIILKTGEVLDITTQRIEQVVIIHSGSDSAYRTRFW